jgi:alkylation response protein AidB-like acyl-CoA dehydrogenase
MASKQETHKMEMQALLERLEGLLPAIHTRREEIERERRLPRDLVHVLRDTGVFALELPRAIGGMEAAPADVLRAIELVSRADGSTGWCVALGLANNGAAGFMQDAGAREVFADPSAPCAGVFAPTGAATRVAGGVRVSGRWQFASGITHCDWAWVGCIVMEQGQPRMTATGPDLIYTAIPTSAIEVHDTWFVSGLCGTGSNDLSAKDVFVPEQRIFKIGVPSGLRPEPLYRMPPIGWFVSHVAAVGLGIARGALDELVALAQTKLPTFSMAVLADKPAAQLEVARAEASLGSARAFFYETTEELWRTVAAANQPTLRQIALHRIATTNAAQVAASVARTASVLAGGTAIFKTSSLQRHARDADAVGHHFTVAPHVWEDAGRVLMGRTPTAPMF